MKDFPENFSGLGKLKHHQVKLHVDQNVKPVNVPQRPIHYHLGERAQKTINTMVKEDAIENYPENKPAPWISCAVITPKPNGDIRVTLDTRNVNKAVQSTNLPIPRQKDIQSKLSGARIFSKLDFKSASWQIELDPELRYLTVFHANGTLYRYKRLTMGLKPAQGDFNVALKPIFAHIPQAHLIHDDLIIAAKTHEEHKEVILQVMQAISNSDLTLNPEKCSFGEKQIKFWGMLIDKDGVRPDPSKVKVLDHISSPTNKEELISFLCMMQSDSEFIANFSKKSAVLREISKSKTKFEWKNELEECFLALLKEFQQDVLLRYFDMANFHFCRRTH